MKLPPQEQIDMAIMWLQSNEGEEGGKSAACKAVADWLQDHSREDWLRREARAAGVPVARLRRKLAEGRK